MDWISSRFLCWKFSGTKYPVLGTLGGLVKKKVNYKNSDHLFETTQDQQSK